MGGWIDPLWEGGEVIHCGLVEEGSTVCGWRNDPTVSGWRLNDTLWVLVVFHITRMGTKVNNKVTFSSTFQ